MKVKIKKDDKEKSYDIIDSWSDVTLEKWLRILDLKDKSNSEEAIATIVALSNIPQDLVRQLPLSDVSTIMSSITEMQKQQDTKLKKRFFVEGIEYGMHPNLSAITLGEYADIEHYIKLGIEKHLPEVMAILFRPVIARKNDAYTIQAYDGDISIRAEILKTMSAEQVQNALVFFWHLGKSVLKATQSFSIAVQKENKTQ